MTKQEHAIKKLKSAVQAMQQAQEYIESALGETDVGAEYKRSIDVLIEELSDDLDAIAAGEVYEFSE